jgi:nucleoside-diphosphate-sugar epimerase
MTTEQQKPTIVMTGCSGFIGEALIERLSDDFNIVGLDVVGPPEGDVDFVEFDITSDDSVREGLEHVRDKYGDTIASVIHLAAFYDFSGAPSPKYQEITIGGTERLLDTLQDFDVEQFIFTSTMLVHEACEPGQRIDEDSPLEANWPYPESKIEAEQVIEEHRGDIPALLLRIAGVYNDEGNSPPIASQIRRIFERRVTANVYPGDLNRGQSFLHLDDLVDAVDAAVERRETLPEHLPILLGEPVVIGYGELQQLIGQELRDGGWNTLRVPKPLAKVGAWIQDRTPIAGDPFIKPWMVDLADDHYALNIDRARKYLGWEPRRSLRDTLPKIIDSLRSDPLAWYERHDFEPPKFLEEKEKERREHAGVPSGAEGEDRPRA